MRKDYPRNQLTVYLNENRQKIIQRIMDKENLRDLDAVYWCIDKQWQGEHAVDSFYPEAGP